VNKSAAYRLGYKLAADIRRQTMQDGSIVEFNPAHTNAVSSTPLRRLPSVATGLIGDIMGNAWTPLQQPAQPGSVLRQQRHEDENRWNNAKRQADGLPPVPAAAPAAPAAKPWEGWLDALAKAETGNEQDPWIRTRHRPAGGSTAWSPWQTTGTFVGDMRKRYGAKWTPEMRQHADRVVQQAAQFNQHGGNKGKPGYQRVFDYGGAGSLTNAADRTAHEALVKQIGQHLYDEGNNTPDKFMQRWRGLKPAADSRYARVFNENLKPSKL
jgi:hypothetical protein